MDRITENEYLILCSDFKKRLEEKNNKLRKLEETIIICWALMIKYTTDGDETYLSDTRDLLNDTMEMVFKLTEV